MVNGNDLLQGIDQRAQMAIDRFSEQQHLVAGIVKSISFGGADIQLDGSARMLRGVQVLEGMELAVGERVLMARAGRMGYVVVGASTAQMPVRDAAPIAYENPPIYGIYDNGSQLVVPNAAGYVSISDDGVVNIDKMGVNSLQLSIVQAMIHHGSISGLDDDDHPQYAAIAQDETISGNWTVTGAWAFQNSLAVQANLTARHILPEAVDTYDIGSSTLLWRKAYISEIEAVLFVENTITLLGGWFMIPHDAGTVAEDVDNSETQIDFGKAMTPGDFVLFRGLLQVEYMQVGTLVSGTTYNVTRNLDGSGANTWPQGEPFAVLGTTGEGRIELNAYDTPRVQLIRQGATYNAQTELIRIGDLNGGWGYSAEKWGIAMGEYASGKGNLVLDQDGAIRMRTYTTTKILLEADGDVFIGENVAAAATTNLAIFTNAQTYNSESMEAGDVLLGDNSASKANILWDKSTGQLKFRGGTATQALINTDGSLIAGGGTLALNSVGIIHDNTGSYDIITVKEASATIGYLHKTAYSDLCLRNGGQYIGIDSGSCFATTPFKVHYSNPISGDVLFYVTDAIDGETVVGHDLRVGEGLWVGGTGYNPDDDDIHYEGNLYSFKNSTNYEVYGIRWLTVPLTSTSWDGDAYSDTAKTLIDMSAVFGAPAGIKAVLLKISIRDSGSGASDCVLCLAPNNTAWQGAWFYCPPVNDRWSGYMEVIPCDSNGDIYYQIDASGASTFDVFLEVWGYAI